MRDGVVECVVGPLFVGLSWVRIVRACVLSWVEILGYLLSLRPADAMLHICDSPCCLVPAGVGPPLCGATATVPGRPVERYEATISARCRQINAAV